jgi:hypothetical protein
MANKFNIGQYVLVLSTFFSVCSSLIKSFTQPRPNHELPATGKMWRGEITVGRIVKNKYGTLSLII